MKKIIKNKVYDTQTAKKHGEYEPNPYKSDFHWFCETLYQKKTGEFFLYGEGNAASKYSRLCGQNEYCPDERITPLSYEEAQEWAGKHLDGDEYIAIFGEPEENDDITHLHISLTKQSADKLRQQAAQKGLTVSGYINSLI